MQTRFTILGLMEFTALIGLIIGADRMAFRLLPIAWTFVGAIATINAMSGAYLGIRLRGGQGLESTIRSARVTSICVSLVNSLVIAAILAEGVRRRAANGEYVDWSRVWIEVLLDVAFVSTVSTASGMLLSMFFVAVWEYRSKTARE
jgi:hypothetical protein